MNMRIFVSLIILASFVSAAACASKSYSAACNKCDFDSDGKLDKACYEGYQSSGVSCLFAAYPLESISYQMGNCPAVDVCKDRLETCKALYSSDNDKKDCSTGDLDHCFTNADRCVDYAVKHCDEEPPGAVADLAPPPAWCDNIFFLFIPLFAGALAYRRK
jgi:hypothetical protein